MKKFFLALIGVAFSPQVMAWQNCGDIEEGVPSNCEYEISDGVLTIRPQDNTKEATIPDYERDTTYTRYEYHTTSAPWRWVDGADGVTTLKIESGITSIGTYAFEDMGFSTVVLPDGMTSIKNSAFKECDYLSNINLPDSLREIGNGAFGGTSLTNVVIPSGTADNPTTVEATAFRGSDDINGRGVYGLQMESFVVGENVILNQEIFIQGKTDKYPLMDLDKFTMYCAEGNQSCIDAMAKTVEIAQKRGLIDSSKTASDYIKIFTKDENGFYQTEDGKIFANADLMAHGAACTSEQNCKDIVAAAQQNASFRVGGNTYSSLEDFAKGDSTKFRIYTIKEANEAAGKKNRVMIRYK